MIYFTLVHVVLFYSTNITKQLVSYNKREYKHCNKVRYWIISKTNFLKFEISINKMSMQQKYEIFTSPIRRRKFVIAFSRLVYAYISFLQQICQSKRKKMYFSVEMKYIQISHKKHLIFNNKKVQWLRRLLLLLEIGLKPVK